jgi:molybdopterin-guanine dinucleotide biosynthesis protein A
MSKRAAIILAGGKAKRFQVKPGQLEDKALALLFGKPLLIHIIERINDVVEETPKSASV